MESIISSFPNTHANLMISSFSQSKELQEIIVSGNSEDMQTRLVFHICVTNNQMFCTELVSWGAVRELGLEQNHMKLLSEERMNKNSFLHDSAWCSSDCNHSSCSESKMIRNVNLSSDWMETIVASLPDSLFSKVYALHDEINSADCWPWVLTEKFTMENVCPCCPCEITIVNNFSHRKCKNLGWFRFFNPSDLPGKTVTEMSINQQTLLNKFALARTVYVTDEYQARQAEITRLHPEIPSEGPWSVGLIAGNKFRYNSEERWTPALRPACCIYDSTPCKNGFIKDSNHIHSFVHKYPNMHKCDGINPEKSFSTVMSENLYSPSLASMDSTIPVVLSDEVRVYEGRSLEEVEKEQALRYELDGMNKNLSLMWKGQLQWANIPENEQLPTHAFLAPALAPAPAPAPALAPAPAPAPALAPALAPAPAPAPAAAPTCAYGIRCRMAACTDVHWPTQICRHDGRCDRYAANQCWFLHRAQTRFQIIADTTVVAIHPAGLHTLPNQRTRMGLNTRN